MRTRPRVVDEKMDNYHPRCPSRPRRNHHLCTGLYEWMTKNI